MVSVRWLRKLSADYADYTDYTDRKKIPPQRVFDFRRLLPKCFCVICVICVICGWPWVPTCAVTINATLPFAYPELGARIAAWPERSM